MTRRVSKRTGREYQVGSTSGWGGWTGSRICRVCDRPVTTKDTAVVFTEITANGKNGAMFAEHVRCRLIPGYPNGKIVEATAGAVARGNGDERSAA